MEVTTAIQISLRWLFERYLENPNGIWNIADCTECHAEIELVHQLGRVMTFKGYVKNSQALEDGFYCSITTLGIMQVSNELSNIKYKILAASIEEQKLSLMEILEAGPHHFKRVQDYAMYLKQTGIIECIFHDNDVFARPTFFGKIWYEATKAKSVN